LHNIAIEARASGIKATLQKVALYLRDIFPTPPQRRQKQAKRRPITAAVTKKEARRREYGAIQTLWQRNRRRCVAGILDPMGPVNQLPREMMEPYWSRIMTRRRNVSTIRQYSDPGWYMGTYYGERS